MPQQLAISPQLSNDDLSFTGIIMIAVLRTFTWDNTTKLSKTSQRAAS